MILFKIINFYRKIIYGQPLIGHESHEKFLIAFHDKLNFQDDYIPNTNGSKKQSLEIEILDDKSGSENEESEPQNFESFEENEGTSQIVKSQASEGSFSNNFENFLKKMPRTSTPKPMSSYSSQQFSRNESISPYSSYDYSSISASSSGFQSGFSDDQRPQQKFQIYTKDHWRNKVVAAKKRQQLAVAHRDVVLSKAEKLLEEVNNIPDSSGANFLNEVMGKMTPLNKVRFVIDCTKIAEKYLPEED